MHCVFLSRFFPVNPLCLVKFMLKENLFGLEVSVCQFFGVLKWSSSSLVHGPAAVTLNLCFGIQTFSCCVSQLVVSILPRQRKPVSMENSQELFSLEWQENRIEASPWRCDGRKFLKCNFPSKLLVEVTYKSWYPAFLGHISVSMIVLVVEVSSAIVLMFLQVSKDHMWCRVVYVFGARY
jgi:hypothetical protein